MDEQNKSAVDVNKGLLSFTIRKKKENKSLKESSIAENVVDDKEKTDFIVGIDTKKIESVEPKEEKKELVIPLITKNRWKGHETQSTNQEPPLKKIKTVPKQTKQPVVEEQLNQLENEAVKEIIKETNEYNDTWEDRDKEDLNLTIPLLMVNKPPEGFETDDKLDVSIRPNEADEADYEAIPISSFGMAMLRGMGWNENEGIGNKMKKVVAPVEAVSRPKGQGLGADRGPGRKEQSKGKGNEGSDEAEGFVKGAGILVTRGPHKNLYGLIEATDEDNSRLVVKLALSGQRITLSQFSAQSVSKSDYKKYAKDLGKFSRGHDELKKRESKKDDEREDKSYKEKRRETDKRSSSSHKDDQKHKNGGDDRLRQEYESKADDKSGDRSRDKERRRHRDEDSHKSESRHEDKTRRRDDDHRVEDRKSKYDRMEKSEAEESKEGKRREKERYWLRPDLRVRFIDKAFKSGRYYNSKVRVVDVQERDVCSCQTDEGMLLHDIHQNMLETLIPKSNPGYIMIVQGKHRGQVGNILNKDKRKCKADVQLLRDREDILRLSYDDICEYVGDIHAAEDL